MKKHVLFRIIVGIFILAGMFMSTGCDNKSTTKNNKPTKVEITAMHTTLWHKHMGEGKIPPPNIINEFTQVIDGETWYVYDSEAKIKSLFYNGSILGKPTTFTTQSRWSMVKRGNNWEGKWISNKDKGLN